MNTLNKTLIAIFFVQLLALGATQLGGRDQLSVERIELFPDLQAEKVSKIEISGPADESGERVVLERSGEDWTVASAEGYPAKGADVEDLLKKLSELVSRNVVLESARYHDKLEVTEAAHQRKVVLQTGGESMTFFLGSSPKFKNAHFRFEGEDQVVLAPLSTSDLGNRAWNWVERSYVSIPKKDVWRVQLDNEQGAVTFERDPATDSWSASALPAVDKAELDGLLSKVTSLRLEEPVGKTESPDHGLSSPVATVTLSVGTSTSTGLPPVETVSRTLRVGAKADGKAQRFVKMEDQDFIVRVMESALEPVLKKAPSDFAPSKDDE